MITRLLLTKSLGLVRFSFEIGSYSKYVFGPGFLACGITSFLMKALGL